MDLAGGTPLERAVLMLMERVAVLEDRVAASEREVTVLGDLAAMQENGPGISAAQRAGRVDVLELLMKRPEGREMVECMGFVAATDEGRTDVLRWADDKGLLEFAPGMYNSLAAAGDVEGLQWLRSRGCPPSEDACTKAAVRGRTEALRHLLALFPPFPWRPKDAFEGACRKGQLEAARLVHSEAPRLGKDFVRGVRERLGDAHPEVARWLAGLV